MQLVTQIPREEGRTYSQRTFTMKNGLVVPVTLDTWFWQQLDKFAATMPDCDAIQINSDICFDVAQEFAKQENISFRDAFAHTLAFAIQENMSDL